MQIKVNDLEHILKQIQDIEKPTTKEHNKVLNALKIFLEDNTDVQDPAILKIKQELLASKFYSLSKTRRELPKELREEFKKFISQLKEQMVFKLEDKQEDFDVKFGSTAPFDVFKDIKKINEESQGVCERIDLATSNLSVKDIKKSNSNKTIINYFKTL